MPNYSTIRLSTERLDLRPLDDGDEMSLFAIFANPDFMRYWSCPPWTSIDQATAMIRGDREEMAKGLHIRLAIVLRATNQLIGTCSLFKIDAQCRRAEVGYGIVPSHWRLGYMNEAIAALIGYGFSVMKLNRLEADIDPRNVASAKSLEKLGFTREGFLRERWIVDGIVSDSALYGLLTSEWCRL